MSEPYIILEETSFPAKTPYVAHSIILVKKAGEYVTWLRNDDTGGVGQGHYFSYYQYPGNGVALKAATEDYIDRVRRDF